MELVRSQTYHSLNVWLNNQWKHIFQSVSYKQYFFYLLMWVLNIVLRLWLFQMMKCFAISNMQSGSKFSWVFSSVLLLLYIQGRQAHNLFVFVLCICRYKCDWIEYMRKCTRGRVKWNNTPNIIGRLPFILCWKEYLFSRMRCKTTCAKAANRNCLI